VAGSFARRKRGGRACARPFFIATSKRIAKQNFNDMKRNALVMKGIFHFDGDAIFAAVTEKPQSIGIRPPFFSQSSRMVIPASGLYH
jgi:hypothetical protein